MLLHRKRSSVLDDQERAAVRAVVGGGLWDEMGQAQIDFLLGRGLQPTDVMLDVGCGGLRGGLHFVRYLDPGNYVGVDKSQRMLDFGLAELDQAGLADRRPTLVCDSDFAFGALGREFDVAFAQSVFSHLPLNDIHRCLVGIAEVVRSGGVFYATFFDNPGDPHDLSPIDFPQPDGPPVRTYPDADPYRYHVRFFEALVDGLPLKVDHIGAWGSLRGQSMLAFQRI
jgi:SAM-dependent methyltransferase